MNVDILGISKIKWTGMGEFNSDDHYIYYCGQEPFRRNGVTIIVYESPKCSTWMQSQKQQNDLMANLDSILKSRDITSLTQVCIVKALVFPVVMYGCESWTIKRAEQ